MHRKYLELWWQRVRAIIVLHAIIILWMVPHYAPPIIYCRVPITFKKIGE